MTREDATSSARSCRGRRRSRRNCSSSCSCSRRCAASRWPVVARVDARASSPSTSRRARWLLPRPRSASSSRQRARASDSAARLLALHAVLRYVLVSSVTLNDRTIRLIDNDKSTQTAHVTQVTCNTARVTYLQIFVSIRSMTK